MDAQHESAQDESGGYGKAFLRQMPVVLAYDEQLRTLNKQWVRTTLTGKINSSRVASTLIDFMEATQSKFLALQEKLILTLCTENCRKVVQELNCLSQVAIDILKRNLFERTADVGFLATDADICEFLALEAPTSQDVERIEDRLRAYRDKYTVYDEIVILGLQGQVQAHLDGQSDIRRSQDPLLQETLNAGSYVETFRATDIRPGKGETLIYSHRIDDPASKRPLGVLCLCFDLAREMQGIYSNLLQDAQTTICLMDDAGTVFTSSDPNVAAPGASLPMALEETCNLHNLGGGQHLVKTARTNGYQGFIGLPWYGQALRPVAKAFHGNGGGAGNGDECDVRQTRLFTGELKAIDDDADDVLSDLGLVVLNGEVMAAKQIVNADEKIKQEANALPPVLSAIKGVGESIRDVFATSIGSLLQTVIASRMADAEFFASLAIDIMDRNLYERANDCRWWALTSLFREALAKGRVSDADRQAMHEVLAYINSLYTVYTNLILFDRDGRVMAVSQPKAQGLVGSQLTGGHMQRCLQIRDPQHYCVSDFVPFAEYAGDDGQPRHTYIYNAPVLHPAQPEQVVGGIAIVFDSEPEFRAMLTDALPRDEQGRLLQESIGLFVDGSRRIISSTSDAWPVGKALPISEELTRIKNGERRSGLVEIHGQRYIMGCAMSAGYREYKRDGVYQNDVLAVMLIAI